MRLQIGRNLVVLKYWKLEPNITGICSSAGTGFHTLFLDLDHTRNMVKRIKKMQTENRLDNIYVFKSSPGRYHAICLDKLKFGRCMDLMQEYFKKETAQYRIVGATKGRWVLRFTKKGKKPKPKLYKVLKGESLNEKSLAHALFLQKMYGVKTDVDSGWYDQNPNIKMDFYTTVRS